MQIILALSIIVSVWLAGCATALLFNRKNAIEVTSLGFILGTLLFTVLVLIVHQYGQQLITAGLVLTVAYSLGFVALGILGWQRHHIIQSLKTTLQSLRHNRPWIKLGVIFLAILFLSSLLQDYFWPVTDWDALALYDFRARIVAETGSFVDGIRLGYFFQYPPFTSLLHTSLYVVGFERAKIWYSFLYISLIGVFYALLRKHTSQPLSLLGAVMLAVNPLILEHATMAYTNLSHTLFLSLGILYILDWFRQKAASTLLLGSVLVMGSTWVRITEPFWIIPLLILISIVILSTFQKKSWKYATTAIVGLLLIFLGKSVWQNFLDMLFSQNVISPTTTVTPPIAAVESAFQVESYNWLTTVPVLSAFKPYIVSFFSKDGTFILQRAREIASYMFAYILPTVAAYLVPAVLLAAFELPKKEHHTLALWCVIVLYLLLLFVGTFVFSLIDGSWNQIGGSANRMSMFLIPLFIFAICSPQSLQVWIKKTTK